MAVYERMTKTWQRKHLIGKLPRYLQSKPIQLDYAPLCSTTPLCWSYRLYWLRPPREKRRNARSILKLSPRHRCCLEHSEILA
jgi:hypothetical protein